QFRLHGFRLLGNSLSTIDGPGSRSTVASGINNAGDIVGTYEVFLTLPPGFGGPGAGIDVFQAFLLSEGSFRGISGINANGINNAGDIVGRYVDGRGNHGFLLSNGSLINSSSRLIS